MQITMEKINHKSILTNKIEDLKIAKYIKNIAMELILTLNNPQVENLHNNINEFKKYLIELDKESQKAIKKFINNPKNDN
jgi:hypothetical protein